MQQLHNNPLRERRKNLYVHERPLLVLVVLRIFVIQKYVSRIHMVFAVFSNTCVSESLAKWSQSRDNFRIGYIT